MPALDPPACSGRSDPRALLWRKEPHVVASDRIVLAPTTDADGGGRGATDGIRTRDLLADNEALWAGLSYGSTWAKGAGP